MIRVDVTWCTVRRAYSHRLLTVPYFAGFRQFLSAADKIVFDDTFETLKR
jgi:hypothetical protein